MAESPSSPTLIRGIGLPQATALNINNMIGIGPFITLPLIIADMGGPQAILCWIVGALVAVCDGQVWAELSARLPGSGGSYVFLRESYGPRWGQLMSFLFIWQICFQGPLSFAGGSIGFAKYFVYLFPSTLHWQKAVAATIAILVVYSLFQRITAIGKMANIFAVVSIIVLLVAIVAGLKNFSWTRLTDFPPGAFNMTTHFWIGLGDASRRGIYAFLGYYNVCFLGDEVKNPSKTIPRSIMLAVAIVSVLYIGLYATALGSIPWREIIDMPSVAAEVVARAFGHTAGQALALAILATAVASISALMLANSRVLYAAARDGRFFSFFARVHPKDSFPYVSLLALGAVAVAFTFIDLRTVISSLVIIRSIVQFIGQNIGLYLLRRNRPDLPMPFKMWLYPLPGIIALIGWLFIFFTGRAFILLGGAFVVTGVIAFLIHQTMRKEWPFAKA